MIYEKGQSPANILVQRTEVSGMPGEFLPGCHQRNTKKNCKNGVEDRVEDHSEIEGDRCVRYEPQRDPDEDTVSCPPFAFRKGMAREKNDEDTPARNRETKNAINPGLERLNTLNRNSVGPENRVDLLVERQIKELGLI